ncbi:MAG TPA: 2-hydroxyacid dehydrogenase [Chitinophagaceae bacterium]
MNVAVFSTQAYDREFLDRLNATAHHRLTYFEAPLNSETTNLAQDFEAVCIFVNDRLDQTAIGRMAAMGIQAIVLRCAGFNNVDLEAARLYGIKVLRVPAYSPHAVAEHAVALILTLNRKTHKAFNRIRENNFSLERLMGFNLYGKTVGVVGTGQIGSVFCRIMLGFGCQVKATDIAESRSLVEAGVVYLPLRQLLPSSDIISLHCPLTPETYHLVDHEGFAQMKRGAMLINTSRGAVINTAAAVAALKSGQLGYLGIDVYEQEESLFFRDLSERIVPDDLIARLMTFPNVLITAHQGFFTGEAMEQIAATTLNNISDLEAGRPLPNEVTGIRHPKV